MRPPLCLLLAGLCCSFAGCGGTDTPDGGWAAAGTSGSVNTAGAAGSAHSAGGGTSNTAGAAGSSQSAGSGGTSSLGGSGGKSSAAGSGGKSSAAGSGGTAQGGSGGSSSGKACGGFLGSTCSAQEYCAYVEGQLCGAADASSTCKPRPVVCSDIFAPVCGCDGKTYSSDCTAAASGTGVNKTGMCSN